MPLMEQGTPRGMALILPERLQTQLLMTTCSILWLSVGKGVRVVCVADSLLIKVNCPSGATVTMAQVSVCRYMYIYQVMLHSLEHAESVVSSYFKRSSSIFVTHPGVRVE